MEWNMEENFGMEWNMEWKIFSMELEWNGRKLQVWNMEKSSSIPFHTIPCPAENTNCKSLTVTADRKVDLFSYSYLVD